MRALAFLLLTALPCAAQDRIVSLGGSVSEIVAALGAQDRLIARDSTTLFPPALTDLPDVGYVRALSPEGVLSVGPDLILAEAGAGPVEAVEALEQAGIPFVTIPESPTPEGVLAKIGAVAEALDLETKGAALTAQVQDGFAKAAAARADVTAPKKVLFVLSMQGGRIMAGGEGSSAAGIIALAGGENAAQGFQGYKQMTDEAVMTAAPDVIVMMDRDGDHAAANAELFAHPALTSSPAAQNGAVVRMDGLLLLGFGPRTPEAAMALHDAIYGG